jgi:hypothetical protein
MKQFAAVDEISYFLNCFQHDSTTVPL